MTIKKTIITLILSVIFMGIAILFYATNVSRMNFRVGQYGFLISSMIVIVTLHLSRILLSKNFELETESNKQKFNRQLNVLDWISFLAVSSMGILLVFIFFIIPSRVEQNSMSPTLLSGDRVLVYHFKYTPKKDDIVVSYMLNYGDDEYYVKRIFAVPGDHISFLEAIDGDYYIYINHVRVESISSVIYKISEQGINLLNLRLDVDGYLMDDYYMILGDNATGSTDSRLLGFIHKNDIVGKVIFKF